MKHIFFYIKVKIKEKKFKALQNDFLAKTLIIAFETFSITNQ